MPALDLYHMELSAPCRSVRMVAKEIGVELNLIEVNLFAKEQMTPEFIKLNPQHTIPTLVDGDFSMGESRAQMCYLVNKYAPGHKLYPTCPQTRATVDRLLYFDMGTMYKAIGEYFYPQMMDGKAPDPEKEAKLKEALQFVEDYLGDKPYFTGDNYTLADISIGASLTMLDVSGYGFAGYNKAEAFYKRIKEIPCFEEMNEKGVAAFKEFIASKKQA